MKRKRYPERCDLSPHHSPVLTTDLCPQLETINKLLKKPAPKRRTRAEIMAAQAAAENMPYEDDGSERPRPTPLYTRYVQTQAGARLGVPEEWLDKDQPLGDALRPGWSGPRRRNKLVEEVA